MRLEKHYGSTGYYLRFGFSAHKSKEAILISFSVLTAYR